MNEPHPPDDDADADDTKSKDEAPRVDAADTKSKDEAPRVDAPPKEAVREKKSPRPATPSVTPKGSPYRSAPEAEAGEMPVAIRRAIFYGAWALVPILLALGRDAILVLLPKWAFVDTLRGQPIPVAIVLFTLTAIILWYARFWLPGASWAGIGGRPGFAPGVRRRFEAARALAEEARSIRKAHAKEIERSLRREQQEEIDTVLEELSATMNAKAFDLQRFDAAYDKAATVVDDRLGRWRKSELREYGESIAVAVLVALGIRAFVIEAFKIPSGSMIPTLLVGDHIFVNKLAYGPLIPFTKKRVWTSMPPKRGDVIVFAFPENPEEDFIKRTIALPGDKLEMRDSRIWLDDKAIPRCFVGRTSYLDVPETGPMPMQPAVNEGDLYVEYLDDQSYLTFYTLGSLDRTNAGPWYPKQGEVYVLGDNRNNSRDSREWWNRKGGGVPYENIRGRALWIWLSYTSSEKWKGERIGMSVMGQPRLPSSMKELQPQLDRCMQANPPLDCAQDSECASNKCGGEGLHRVCQ